MSFGLQNGASHLPASFARQIDVATAEMSDKDRMLFLMGVALAMRYAAGAMTEVAVGLKNSAPDLLSGPVTVRRVSL